MACILHAGHVYHWTKIDYMNIIHLWRIPTDMNIFLESVLHIMYGNGFQTDFSLKYELLFSVKSTFENINTSYIPLPIHDCYLLLYASTLNISQVMVSNQISMLLKNGNTLSLKM